MWSKCKWTEDDEEKDQLECSQLHAKWGETIGNFLNFGFPINFMQIDCISSLPSSYKICLSARINWILAEKSNIKDPFVCMQYKTTIICMQTFSSLVCFQFDWARNIWDPLFWSVIKTTLFHRKSIHLIYSCWVGSIWECLIEHKIPNLSLFFLWSLFWSCNPKEELTARHVLKVFGVLSWDASTVEQKLSGTLKPTCLNPKYVFSLRKSATCPSSRHHHRFERTENFAAMRMPTVRTYNVPRRATKHHHKPT